MKTMRKQALIDNPKIIDNWIQELVCQLNTNELYLELSHYDIDLIRIQNSQILTQWQALVEFDEDTICFFAPNLPFYLRIDLAENWLFNQPVEVDRHWIYDVMASKIIEDS